MKKLFSKSGENTQPGHRERRLKVLFLNTRDSLGADVAVHLSLIANLDRSQVEVWVASGLYEKSGPSTLAALGAIPGIMLLPLELGRSLGQGLAGRVKSFRFNALALLNLLRLSWLCRRQKIGVIHVTDRPRDALFGLLLARLGGSRCLIHAHTSYDRRNLNRLGDWVLKQADAVVGVSHFTANTYRREAGIAPQKVFAVHNAVDAGVFRPDLSLEEPTIIRRLGICPGGPLIGCVARLSRWKDQATLLEALAELRTALPGVRLVLAGANFDSSPDGQGTYQEYLERRIKALGLENAVTFAGYLDHQEMPGLYNGFDVLAHPAVEEPFGLAVVEAMASGRPVVAVGEGGICEIIRDGLDG